MAADPVRDEAERLVAAAIAAVSMAARGLPNSGTRPIATGSPECCVCPVCRLIAAMRDPDDDLTDRLATGAGDLAAGVASMLRSLSRPSGGTHAEPEEDAEGDAFWEALRQRARGAADYARGAADYARGAADYARGTSSSAGTEGGDPWRTATTTPPPPPPMAKKAVKKAAPAKAPAPDSQDASEPPPSPRKVVKKAAKKAAPPGATSTSGE